MNLTPELILKTYLGVPYQHRGRALSGLDCWGLVLGIYAQEGIALVDINSTYERNWAAMGKNYFLENAHRDWVKVDSAQLLDVVLFSNSRGIANHAGVMLDTERFINTRRAGTVVDKISALQWKRRIAGFYRYKNFL